MNPRTDLALEAQELWRHSAGENTALSGVKARHWDENGVNYTEVEIVNKEGEATLGKPIGRYLTLEAPNLAAAGVGERLGELLGEFLSLKPQDRVLMVGLGNRAITPDGIGPLTAERVFVTGHLPERLPELFGDIRPVYALIPGVLGTTGLESADIVKAVVERERPDKIIVVDALAAASRDRLCRAIQLSDSGIVPGSGVGNARAAFSRDTLGVPVCALGVPTVIDAGEKEPLMVTPRDIDVQVRQFSGLLSAGINRALFPDWSESEIAQLQNLSS